MSSKQNLTAWGGCCVEHPADCTVCAAVFLPTRPELDACDVPEKYPQLFQVTLDIEVQPQDKVIDLTPPWEHYCTKDVNPSILFSSQQEHQDTLALGGMGHGWFEFLGWSLCVTYCVGLFPVFGWPCDLCLTGQAPADLPPDHPRNLGQGGFFASLCWQGMAEPLSWDA